jgi:RNA recognition motif-containing protein
MLIVYLYLVGEVVEGFLISVIILNLSVQSRPFEKNTKGKINKMSKKLYVGNLSYDAQENDIKELFAQFGEVSDIHVPVDKFTNRPRGFAFITLENGADEAIEKMNGYAFEGRNLNVTEARPKEDRGPSDRGPRSGGGGNSGPRGGSGGGSNFKRNRY